MTKDNSLYYKSNTKLFQLVLLSGKKTKKDLCLDLGVSEQVLDDLSELEMCPVGGDFRYSAECRRIARYFGEKARDLFPLELYGLKPKEVEPDFFSLLKNRLSRLVPNAKSYVRPLYIMRGGTLYSFSR